MLSPDKQAGLVLALSTLAVVTAAYVIEMLRAPPTLAVAGAQHVEEPARPEPPPAATAAPAAGRLAFPVPGFERALRDNFDEARGKRRHNALDIMAPRGTPVVAAGEGRVAKLFRSPAGGLSVYQYDVEESRIFYYAHLDAYAKGLAEGMLLKRGDVVGFVGSTGNAPEHAPHLHFAVFALGADKRWWKGEAVNPYPMLKD